MIKVVVYSAIFGEPKIFTLKEFQEKFNKCQGCLICEGIGGNQIEFIVE